MNAESRVPDPAGGQPAREVFSLFCNRSIETRLVNFYELEQHAGQSFRWSEPVSMIRISLEAGDYTIELDTGCLRGANVSFRFQLHWNETPIPMEAIAVNQGKLSFAVARNLCNSNGEQRLSISCKPLNAENGRRQLGMPLCSLRIFQGRCHDLGPILSFHPKSQKWLPSTRRRRTWLGITNLAPTIPIWQVRMPEAQASPVDRERPVQKKSFPRVVVAPCEINSRHGTGLLIKYLVQDFREVATINSLSCYNDDRVQSGVHHYLPHQKMSRAEIYDQIFNWFFGAPPSEAYVVPYFESDLIISLALRDLFGTRICLHFMDDNCLFGHAISQKIAIEAIEKANLVLAISPEMKQAYEQRFGKRISMLPPIVPDDLIAKQPVLGAAIPAHSEPSKWSKRIGSVLRLFSANSSSKAAGISRSRGVLIGNVWDKQWLDRLRQTVRESRLELDWYSNNPEAVWLKDSVNDLQQDGIYLHDPLWGAELVSELRKRPFAVMPSSELDGRGEKESIARLSLPSRIPFIIATANLPVIVLGHEDTAASKFVERFELGRTAAYSGAQLRMAVDWISNSQIQAQIRNRGFQLSEAFSDRDVGSWVWNSLARGEPIDSRFESLFPAKPGEFQCFFDAEPPAEIHWSFRETWQMLNRIKQQGFVPELVIDVGASTGVWSWTSASIFPHARYVLVDPMMSRYSPQARQYYQRKLKTFELVEAALSDCNGEAELLVSNDLYGSSLLKVDEKTRKAEFSKVEVLTLDELAIRKNLIGRTLLKVDVQYAEHLVLNGGLRFLREQVDAVILELTIEREHPQAKTYREMLDFMDKLGFSVVDEMEGWRDPVTGRLEQKDSVFLRRELIASRRAA